MKLSVVRVVNGSWRATDAFARRRAERKLSQRKLAGAAGVSQSEVCRIEHGLSLPATPTCNALARVLDKPLEALFVSVGAAAVAPMRDDLRSLRQASLQTRVARSAIEAWLHEGLIGDYGVGGQGRRLSCLVSLAEVIEQSRASDWLSRGAAARQLGIAPGRLTAGWALERGIVCKRVGKTNFRFEPMSVDRARELRDQQRLEFLSTRETGLPWWVLRRLESKKRLRLYRGDRGEILVQRQEFVSVLAAHQENPQACLRCGKPLLDIGRDFHRECAGPAAMSRAMSDAVWRAGYRQASSERSRAWWDSPTGRSRRRAQSEKGWPKPRTGRIDSPCFLCGRRVPLKASVAERKETQKQRTVCASCALPWRRARMRAQWKVNRLKPNTSVSRNAYDTVLSAYEIGCRLQEELMGTWPEHRGRRPPVATDLLIEVLHLHGVADTTIERFLSAGLSEGAISIPGLTQPTGPVSPGYVRKRRRTLGIRRTAYRSAAPAMPHEVDASAA